LPDRQGETLATWLKAHVAAELGPEFAELAVGTPAPAN